MASIFEGEKILGWIMGLLRKSYQRVLRTCLARVIVGVFLARIYARVIREVL
jgi:hypothetical protein